MRNLHELDQWRDTGPEVVEFYGGPGDHTCGAFIVPSPIDKAVMRVVASSDGGFDHVSVSRKNRCPNWHELEHVKRMFFRDDEVAYQLHMPPAEHVNRHATTLHLWRSQTQPIPLPPKVFV